MTDAIEKATQARCFAREMRCRKMNDYRPGCKCAKPEDCDAHEFPADLEDMRAAVIAYLEHAEITPEMIQESWTQGLAQVAATRERVYRLMRSAELDKIRRG